MVAFTLGKIVTIAGPSGADLSYLLEVHSQRAQPVLSGHRFHPLPEEELSIAYSEANAYLMEGVTA